jgi:hypothetical protein
MKVKVSYLFLAICAGVVLMASPVRADLGLAGKPPKAAGTAVKNAVAAVYASTEDPAAIQSQIVAILDEAAATGDEDTIRYAIVAVMLAGGADNLDVSKQAIANSMVFTNYQELASSTAAEAETLMTGKEPQEEKRKGPKDEKPGRQEKPGNTELPPQAQNPFDTFPPSDGDIPATEI